MKTKNIHAPLSHRFRRWSRVGYAIFCSLTCAVTIGCVAVSISDKSLQKAVGVSKNTLCSLASNNESGVMTMELLEEEAAIHPSLETVLFVTAADRAAACFHNSSIYFLIKKVEMSLSHFNLFLFYSV